MTMTPGDWIVVSALVAGLAGFWGLHTAVMRHLRRRQGEAEDRRVLARGAGAGRDA